MSDVIPVTGRPLSGTERAAFQHLGLSPGNWAALVAAPFFNRAGMRPPNLQQRSDCFHLETLRRELRTMSGLSEETGRFWRRLGEAPGTADPATRLLAWHLATDLPFGKREHVLHLLEVAAGEFVTGTHPTAARDLCEDVRLLVDYSLPCATLPPDSAPRWTHVPLPPADGLDALARVLTAPACAWPADPGAPAQLPTLIKLLGEPVADWWGRAHPGRRAVERGAALLSFSERERLYAEVTREWDRAHRSAGGADGAAAPGGALGDGIREWVDAVRKAARQTETAAEPRKSGLVKVLAAAPPPPPAPASARGTSTWHCARCGAETPAALRECRGCHRPRLPAAVELCCAATGEALRLEDGMRVGRAEYRDVFGLPDAGWAAADQFEVARDEARGVWLVRPLGGTRPTWYQGAEVGAAGHELAADGVLSVGGKLELVVRFV